MKIKSKFSELLRKERIRCELIKTLAKDSQSAAFSKVSFCDDVNTRASEDMVVDSLCSAARHTNLFSPFASTNHRNGQTPDQNVVYKQSELFLNEDVRSFERSYLCLTSVNRLSRN